MGATRTYVDTFASIAPGFSGDFFTVFDAKPIGNEYFYAYGRMISNQVHLPLVYK
jgi:hypothetical protein